MSEFIGPLSLHHWQSFTVEHGAVNNHRRLMSSMIIASQRHQLRPVLSQCVEIIAKSSSFEATVLFEAVNDSLSNFDITELPLDTISLLAKLLKLMPTSFFVNLSLNSLISKAKSEIRIPLVAFANILMAHNLMNNQFPLNFSILMDFIEARALEDLKFIILYDDEEFHDEVRIFAFQVLIQLISNYSFHCKNNSDPEKSAELAKIVNNLFEFIAEKALAILCSASTTPSRERFCSALFGAFTAATPVIRNPKEKVVHIEKVLFNLSSMPFDDLDYAVQRVTLRLIKDLTPFTSNLPLLDSIYSKLLNLCGSDFNDVRSQAAAITLELVEKCFTSNEISADFIEITKLNLVEAVEKVIPTGEASFLDTFQPSKSAYLFFHCKSMLSKCQTWDTGLVRLNLVDESLLAEFQTVTSSKEEYDNDAVLLEDISRSIDQLLVGFEDSRSLQILFLLSVGHLIMQSIGGNDMFRRSNGVPVQSFFHSCAKVFWFFFSDTSAAFNDRSLGGFLTGRENPAWAILQTTAKGLATFGAVSSVSSPEENEDRQTMICQIVHRVLFSTLHFGCLEEYSNLLYWAVLAWPDSMGPTFEKSLCCVLMAPEDTENEELQLSPAEVRRGGGLPFAFVALLNGLAKIGRHDDVERILRFSILEKICFENSPVSTQTAAFHVFRAIIAYGGSTIRSKFADDIAMLAFKSLRMSSPFQTRNAAIQALTACVHPLIAEGISSVWKFARSLPKLWRTIREVCTTSGNGEQLAQTAALSMLAKMNPLFSPSDADINSASVIDETFEDDLLCLALNSKIAYTRQAAASALVNLACSDPNVDPVQRALKLTSHVVIVANDICSSDQQISNNAVHGFWLIFDRLVTLMQSSWEYGHAGQNSVLVPTLDRCLSSICATLQRLAGHVQPNCSPFIRSLIENFVATYYCLELG